MTKTKMLEKLVLMYKDRYEAKRETLEILKFDTLTEDERKVFHAMFDKEYTQCQMLEDVAKELFDVNLFTMYLDIKFA